MNGSQESGWCRNVAPFSRKSTFPVRRMARLKNFMFISSFATWNHPLARGNDMRHFSIAPLFIQKTNQSLAYKFKGGAISGQQSFFSWSHFTRFAFSYCILIERWCRSHQVQRWLVASGISPLIRTPTRRHRCSIQFIHDRRTHPTSHRQRSFLCDTLKLFSLIWGCEFVFAKYDIDMPLLRQFDACT